jgi:hypothetical protein
MSLRLPSLVRGAVAGAALVTAVAAYGAPSYAAAPSHDRGEFTSEYTYAPGELCDVAVHEVLQGRFHHLDFGDDRGSLAQDYALFTLTNLETGARLTDAGRFSVRERDGEIVVVGNTIKMRDASGKVVVVEAGRTVLDAETFEVISHTPGTGADYASLACPVLGAAPAT